MDEILPAARSELDREKRRALYREAQEILLTESPMLWVAVDNIVEGLQPYVKDYKQSAFTRRSWSLKHVWLDK